MSTAIVSFYTSEGFVIGADRRSRNSDTGEVIDTVQKIFQIQTLDKVICYALAETVAITPENESEIIFDLLKTTKTSAEILIHEHYKSLWSFAEELADAVNRKMKIGVSRANASGRPTRYLESSPLDGGFMISCIILVGYMVGIPNVAMIKLWHKNQVVQKPQIETRLRMGFPPPIAFGPKKMCELVFDQNDHRFKDFPIPRPKQPETMTLKQAIMGCKNFILACQTPLARELEPKSEGVGGHPHIATITLSKGFDWVTGFEPHGATPLSKP